MDCEETDRYLDAYLDGELELARGRELERHLDGCALCRALATDCRQFRSFFSSRVPVYAPPPDLREKIQRALAPHLAARGRRWQRRAVRAALVGSALLLVAAAGVTLWPNPSRRVAAEAVSEHVQALVAGDLLSVVSADPVTVGRWFEAKLGFHVPVTGPPSDFNLCGGRIGAVAGHRVATVLYQKGGVWVALFVWPANPVRLADQDAAVGGYQACTWSRGDLNFVAVSSLSDRDLDGFTDAVKDRVP